ncbi:MAG: endolytic transglycosylase MltG [Muribaculaceae bacterium]|nr:endolytic transglycosylase MltG [Muribaculaceae bacterium]
MTANKKKNNPLTAVYVISLLVAIIVIIAFMLFNFLTKKYNGEPYRLKIPHGATIEQIEDSLANLDLFGEDVYTVWKYYGGSPTTARGSYLIEPGESVLDVAKRLKSGRQTPVKLSFNNVRTINQLADRIADKMDFTAEEFIEALDEILPEAGFTKPQYPAAFIPDSYEFYWTASPQKVISTLLDYRNKFWTDERRQAASALGLTPVGVATIASIVEEESSKNDERPIIARLYINRLDRNMPLQADPTVKFAVGDFGLRRITGKHLQVNSPYNTYKVNGLPPGPIRVVDRKTLEQVLTAPRNEYLYMCAREDFSGYHNFARDLAEHNANAARYRAELNRRGIK